MKLTANLHWFQSGRLMTCWYFLQFSSPHTHFLSGEGRPLRPLSIPLFRSSDCPSVFEWRTVCACSWGRCLVCTFRASRTSSESCCLFASFGSSAPPAGFRRSSSLSCAALAFVLDTVLYYFQRNCTVAIVSLQIPFHCSTVYAKARCLLVCLSVGLLYACILSK